MNEIATLPPVLPPSSERTIAFVDAVAELHLREPQPVILTHHVLHGGVYARTMMIHAGQQITTTLIKVPTVLTICGDCEVLAGDGDTYHVQGYQVLAASAGRKQAYIAHADTFITMAFATSAKTIEEAEAQFTDEADSLMSRVGENIIIITGE
ncbi:hypothetical protein [Bordetella hinzii]|uniref:hypothetical protein n=1 Tax=Bordetella hinzii TaxID=103855 RepID=UPI001F0F9837|nr:hypothetical protein [Bordetella hinzii]